MQKYFNSIKDIATDLGDFEDLLIKIERGSTPSEADLAKLDKLYDALKKARKLDAMPNRSQAFLENYRTQREIKVKLADKSNIMNIVQKIQANQTLAPMEVIILEFYLHKEQVNLPPSTRAQIDGVIEKYLNSYNIPKIALQQTELLDPKALKVINDVIDQITREEYRLSNQGVYIAELGATVKQSSQFMEIRFSAGKFDAIFTEEQFNNFLAQSDRFKPDNNIAIRHYGIDTTAGGTHSGKITYQYGFKTKPVIAKILKIEPDKSTDSLIERKAQDITIMEYHPQHGVLLTTLRHVQQVYVSVGQALRANHKLGHYELVETSENGLKYYLDIKEHGHIERKFANVDSIKGFTAERLKAELTASAVDNNAINTKAKQAIEKSTRHVQPIIDGSDYHAIALFSKDSALNKQFLQQVAQEWYSNASELIKSKRISKIEDLRKHFLLPIARDQLVLETIVKILLQVKILLAQVGETNAKLESTIQKAQYISIELREKFIFKQFKISHE